MNALRKPRYRVDLIGLQALCETNYWRLLKLMPAMAEQDDHRIALDAGDGSQQALHMRVLERCRYTTTLLLSHERQHDWVISVKSVSRRVVGLLPATWTKCAAVHFCALRGSQVLESLRGRLHD